MTHIRKTTDQSGGRQRPNGETLDKVVALEPKERNVKRALAEVLSQIDTSIFSVKTDEVFVKNGLRKEDWQEPLSWNEAAVIACALSMEKDQKPFTYLDVMFLTQENTNQAMVTGAVYRAIESLVKRGLLVEAGTVRNFDRSAKAYRTNEFGRKAFKEAVMAAQTLRMARETRAA